MLGMNYKASETWFNALDDEIFLFPIGFTSCDASQNSTWPEHARLNSA